MLAIRGIWVALAAAVALLAAALVISPRWRAVSQRQVVASFEQQIDGLNESSAAARVNTWRTHDLLAIRPLASALADRRPLVAAAAQETIGDLIADWKRLPASEAVPRLIELAQELADRYGQFAPIQQQFARQVAHSLLLWPLDDADFPADELVAQCERILIAPVPVLPELDPRESLPPIVTPQIATRPSRAPSETPLPTADQQEPAPITDPLHLGSPVADEAAPMPDEVDPQPQEPRQFIRPRVPPIPRPVEPGAIEP